MESPTRYRDIVNGYCIIFSEVKVAATKYEVNYLIWVFQ